MSTSPTRFADQPSGSLYPMLAGTTFARLPFEREESAAGQAHYLVTGAGGAGVQLGYVAQGSSLIPQRYTWVQVQQLCNETEARLIDRLTRSGEAAIWVPMVVETEVFTLAGGGAESFSLARSEARAVEPLFPATAQYPNKAWIDGTEKTVVTTTPADSSEVQVTGTTVATTGAVAGQQLEVRYYPAFTVVARQSAFRYVDPFNQQRAVELLEVG